MILKEKTPDVFRFQSKVLPDTLQSQREKTLRFSFCKWKSRIEECENDSKLIDNAEEKDT